VRVKCAGAKLGAVAAALALGVPAVSALAGSDGPTYAADGNDAWTSKPVPPPSAAPVPTLPLRQRIVSLVRSQQFAKTYGGAAVQPDGKLRIPVVPNTDPPLRLQLPARADPPRAHYASCPVQDRHPPQSHSQAGRHALVPGAPRAILLCRYRGVGSRHADELLAAHRLTRASTIRRLRRDFNDLPAFPPGIFSCPVDDGSAILAFFQYRRARDEPVLVGRRGCRSVSNGQRHRWALTDRGDTLLRRLDSLTG
jgi:hypothetical protein